MITNIERYKKDLNELVTSGEQLLMAIRADFLCAEFRAQFKKVMKDETKVAEYLKKLPSFRDAYQAWYSESLVLLKQLLPDRVLDFIKLYERPKTRRKEITYENYVIEDALHGLHVTRGWAKEKVVGADAAISRFDQQLSLANALGFV